MKNIAVICEDINCAKKLQEAGQVLGFNVRFEVQVKSKIKNELSEKDIKESAIVLFVISYAVEDIENIERFIDREYYEVEPKFVINDAKAVLNEIVAELN